MVRLGNSDGRGGRRNRHAHASPGFRRLAMGPVLERRAYRERARQAVRLLVGDGARRRVNLGVAAVTVVRTVGALIPIVLEGDEGAGRGTVRVGHAAIGHRAG